MMDANTKNTLAELRVNVRKTQRECYNQGCNQEGKRCNYPSAPTIFLRVDIGIDLGRTNGLPAARALIS